MNSNIAWLTTRSSVSKHLIHLVFTVKYRTKALDSCMRDDIEQIMRACAIELNCIVHEFGGENDHVHLLVQLTPTITVATLIKWLKGRSSRIIRERYARQLKPFLWGNHLWSSSYCVVSCGGASIDTIREYIESQDRPP